MNIIIGIVAIFTLIIFRLVNSSLVTSVKRLQNIDEFLEQVTSIEDVEFIDAYKETARWASEKGFILDIYCLLHAQNSGVPIKCISWWSEKYHCYLLFYLAEEGNIIKKVTDFHTHFEPKATLTTGSSVDGLLLPRLKNDFMQCVIDAPLNEQFEQHIKSTKSIAKKYNLLVTQSKYDLFPKLREAIKTQADYITELPLWQHRGFYWYFVKRHLLKYRTY